MKTVYHAADSRGHANHGWLNSYHTFSFANYYNPERMAFGTLRVLNDDTVAAGMGFGAHPHRDMEIVSIPLSGSLEHKDSMGTVEVIQQGEIQVMSAGTGVEHSEYNHSKTKEVKFLQIWLFPKALNLKPRYDQIKIADEKVKDDFQQILSPNVDDAGVWVNQDAWFNLADFTAGTKKSYTLHKEGNGVYIFVLKGDVKVNDQQLSTRDGFGIWDVNEFDLEATSDSEVLLMEVPMELPDYLMR